MPLTILNLEQGMPTVETARRRLEQGLRTARARRVAAVKIIHGYGSSGKGGKIKQDVRQALTQKKRANEIRDFVSGEDFSPFDPSARAILDQCPELRNDRDYTRGNHGITIVLV